MKVDRKDFKKAGRVSEGRWEKRREESRRERKKAR